MAPIQAPLTPEHEPYAPLKTPEDRRRAAHQTTTATTASSRIIVRSLQLLVLLCMAWYIFGPVFVMMPMYKDKLVKTMQGWWGVPKVQPKGVVKGHAEMVRPTYFTIFGVLPLLAIVVLVDILRTYNVRRLSSQLLLRVALVFRRKPSVLGKHSYLSYGEWLFFGAMAVGNLFVFVRYYTNRVKVKKPKHFEGYLECFGLTLGYTCLFNMAFLLLPATRNSAWMEFFNVSYANSIKYHRWLGVVTVVTAFIHGASYYIVWIREGKWIKQATPCFDCDIGKDEKAMKRWQYVFGQLSFLIFAIIGITAIPYVRRKCYNLFYYAHQLFVVAILFLAVHWQFTMWWLIPALVLYCLSRTVSWINGSAPVEVLEVTALSPKLVKVVFKRSAGCGGAYKVGQFLYLNVPAISKLQWHAFTIASSPRTSPTTVTVLLKSLGDWTQDLVTHANECKAKNVLPTVYVDGFYGASLEMYDEYATVCLVAGGIGVTPILAILNDMVAKLSTASADAPKQKIVFLFAFRELALLEALAPVLATLRELDPQQHHVSFHLTMTTAASDEALDTTLLSPTVAPTTVEATGATANRRAFAQPLLSAPFKSMAAIAAFALAVSLFTVIAYGTKIRRSNAKLWLVEQLLEIVVVMLSAVVAVAAVVLAERKLMTQREPMDRVVQDLSAVFTAQPLQVQTYRELLAELNVAVGVQPDVAAFLRQTHANHKVVSGFTQTTIGVFASGPQTLKRAVETAIMEIDSSSFDLREEQFEL